MAKIRIEVYSTNKNNTNWILMPMTSEYLTEKNLIPGVGDIVALAGTDGEKIGIALESSENLQQVKERWFRHANADVAIVLKRN